MARQTGQGVTQEKTQVRLDKWLWAARFYKTRAVAREMIQGGKVQYNGQRTKPSKVVELDAVIRLRQGYDERQVGPGRGLDRGVRADAEQAADRRVAEQEARRRPADLERVGAAGLIQLDIPALAALRIATPSSYNFV